MSYLVLTHVILSSHLGQSHRPHSLELSVKSLGPSPFLLAIYSYIARNLCHELKVLKSSAFWDFSKTEFNQILSKFVRFLHLIQVYFWLHTWCCDNLIFEVLWGDTQFHAHSHYNPIEGTQQEFEGQIRVMLFSFIQALGLLELSEKSPVFGPPFTLYPPLSVVFAK
jgi:hypothetical protein